MSDTPDQDLRREAVERCPLSDCDGTSNKSGKCRGAFNSLCPAYGSTPCKGWRNHA